MESQIQEVNKISEEELENARALQNIIASTHQKIGDLELAKMDLLYEANTHRESLKKLGADLEAKYGRISVNLGTGEYSLIQEGDGSKI
jgi:hypothetical protein